MAKKLVALGLNMPNRKSMDQSFFEPQPPKLKAIIFAEFDNEIGRVIKYQVPHKIFDKERFDAISAAVIPSEEMRDRLIKINIYDYKIIGHSVGIKDKKYAREIYIFNLCFIVLKSSKFDTVYEPLVQKCAEYLVDLEKEQRFLSHDNNLLPRLMEEIFYGLNKKGECIYTVTDHSTIYLKMCPSFNGQEPPIVNPYLVPVFTRIPPPTTLEKLNKMDVLSQKICPQIDGIKCVKDIAYAVQIDVDLVSRCIRNLCFYGCINLLPLFLYSNSYIPTERIRLFFVSPKIIEQCLKFVKLKNDEPDVRFVDVCRLYLSLKRGICVRSWCQRMYPREMNIDERKLIQFGIFYGFLCKLLIYPIANNDENITEIAGLCNGERSFEELALHYSYSPLDLEKSLITNGNFTFIIH